MSKVIKTTQEDFNDIVEDFQDAFMIDLTRVKKATNGNFIVENETSDSVPRIVSIEDISEYHSKIVKEEVDAMMSGKEYDIITIVRPRQVESTIDIIFQHEIRKAIQCCSEELDEIDE